MMERDFMGLNSKETVTLVKEEVVEGCKDSGVPWPVCNKMSGFPRFMSYKAAQDEKMSNILSDNFASSGLMTMPPTDAFDTNYKHHSGESQTIIGASSKQQFLGGVPVAVPRPIPPSSGFLAGTTDSWYNPKAGGGPAQLTIFYAGTVNVFDDITPEKAQAIMLLAGNHCVAQNIAQKRLQVQSPPDKLAARDGVFGNPTMNTPPNSALSSPISVSSHPVGQTGGSPTRNDEAKPPKTIGISANLVNKVEASNLMVSLGPVASPTMIPSAVPQFRKASLARFLEKRKERVMNSSPYNLMKKTSGDGKPESPVAGASAASGSPSSSKGSP